MKVASREILLFRLSNGRCPFEEWFDGLRSLEHRQAVDSRLTRIRDGNFGDHKSVAKGVYELRIHIGAGVRVYYALTGRRVVILLCGGDKGSQQKDIANAQRYWKLYQDES